MTDWICLPFTSHCSSASHCKRQNEATFSDSSSYVLVFFNCRFPSVLLTSVSFSLDSVLLLAFKGFLLLLVQAGIGLYMYIHICIYSIYCMKKDFSPILKESSCTLKLGCSTFPPLL